MVKSSKKVSARQKAARKAKQKAHKAAKPAQKRTMAQPISSRTRVYNLTREVPEHKYFILANGRPVRNVAELAALLDQLEDHVFHHHVSTDRNDFHNWVRDVFEDLELARKITGVHDKKHLQLVIYRHLAGHD